MRDISTMNPKFSALIAPFIYKKGKLYNLNHPKRQNDIVLVRASLATSVLKYASYHIYTLLLPFATAIQNLWGP